MTLLVFKPECQNNVLVSISTRPSNHFLTHMNWGKIPNDTRKERQSFQQNLSKGTCSSAREKLEMKLIHLLAGKFRALPGSTDVPAGSLQKGQFKWYTHTESSSSRGINVCVCAVSMYASGLPPINRTHVTFICPVCAASVYFMAQPWSAAAAFWGPVNGASEARRAFRVYALPGPKETLALGFWICTITKSDACAHQSRRDLRNLIENRQKRIPGTTKKTSTEKKAEGCIKQIFHPELTTISTLFVIISSEKGLSAIRPSRPTDKCG